MNKKLEVEGDIAADYLEEFLDIIDVDGDIEIDVRHDRPAVDIIAESADLQKLVGLDGEVLEALQDLARLAVAAKTGDRSRLMLDVAGYRKAQTKILTDTAEDAIALVRANGQPYDLEPMNAFERKVVHDVISDAGLHSESHGADPYRYVTISLPVIADADDEADDVDAAGAAGTPGAAGEDGSDASAAVGAEAPAAYADYGDARSENGADSVGTAAATAAAGSGVATDATTMAGQTEGDASA